MFDDIKNNFALVCSILIVQIALDISRMMTITHFTPPHRYVADILVFLYFYGIKMFYDKKYCFQVICLIFITFGILIYLEVLIVHICEMERNTQINIDKRGENDCKDIENLLVTSVINNIDE